VKKIILLAVILAGGFLSQTANAQVTFRVNIGSQPIWGPSGYDHVEYYYLPEIEAYYYVPTRQYIYLYNGRWITRSYLPQRYRDFDMYNTRKIVVNDRKPYLRHNEYKSKYSNYRDHQNQQSIRDSRDSRYYQNRQHPEYNNWKMNQRNQKQREQREQRNQREHQKSRGNK